MIAIKTLKSRWAKLPRKIQQWGGFLLSSGSVYLLIFGLRWLGWLQPSEWAAFDLFIQLRPVEPVDERIIIVGVQESDIRYLGKWPVSDLVLAKILNKIRVQQPKVIGLDLYRDIPVGEGYAELEQVFKTTPNLIGIEKSIGDRFNTVIAPPPTLKALGQVAANDVIVDPDGRLRRALLYPMPAGNEGIPSLGLAVALAYLKEKGIEPQSSTGGYLQLGKTIFKPLESSDGSYVRTDAGGYQILMNYHGSSLKFRQVSLEDVLENRIPANLMRDRIVLIGAQTPSLNDIFYTPYSSNFIASPTQISGVEFQANIIKMVVGSVLEDRPLIKVWTDVWEELWIAGWAIIGSAIVAICATRRFLLLVSSVLFFAVVLIGSTYLLFLAGWWIPFAPCVLTYTVSMLVMQSYVYVARLRELNAALSDSIELLAHDASHDALTGLPNRNLFMDRVEHAIKYSKRHPSYLFAIFFIDLDRFKMINDSLGHNVGDLFLQEIAKLLQSCLRSIDTVARIGGDEFTILIDDIQDVSEALIVADRILNRFLSPVMINGEAIYPSASIGIVINTQDYNSCVDLLRDADIAMYRAKDLGKGRYTLFDQEMYEQTLRLTQLESELHYALEHQEFELYYQPIVSLKNERLTGFEALIRWKNPKRGFISPIEFIPLAEDTGLIVAVGDWVMQEACQQLQDWLHKFPEAANLKMSINLASHQIRESDLLDKLDLILSKTGIDGNSIRLEITESTLMDQSEQTINKLSQLRARNIQLSIDDFGQGYSSLSYLHRFPINILKIDRAFVNQMTDGGENIEIVRTITVLAHTLNMSVVAEGVETQQQADILKGLGCEFGQGYLFSRPLTAADAEMAIAKSVSLSQVS
ncbi:EAL domain-containing protein [Pseudanabaena sp. ABRG5-3]|uniref:EAL domain-containing protein n=1 Tax=Pseudanabaena sp. ABRG5-3 TaxID=685565 RepID=UPI000DC6EBD8|nr:EAL domain-containing protein [Pseudanabaena sp. ABRG5-3]BBC24572.1 diguanylate cyclase/phosphodiesterase with Chase sensor [Pseudanabaena sp. ABRG5-3]